MGRLRRVVVAPGAYKGTLSAPAVASAIAAGVRDVAPAAHVACVPVADGGDGTGAVLAPALGARVQEAMAADPLGRRAPRPWWRCPGGGTAFLESATTCGYALLAASERDPANLGSAGLFEQALAAWDLGVRRFVLGVGGTATVDGGAGFLRAAGARLCDRAGRPIDATNPILAEVATLDGAALHPLCTQGRWELWLDVDAPLLGPVGAARAFGPQKGADAALVEQLEQGLERWADALGRATGRDPRCGPAGIGAGGGIPAALWAVAGASVRPGAEAVIRSLGLRSQLAGADACITGEGALDRTSAQGKAPTAVARCATAMGVPVAWVVGRATKETTAARATLVEPAAPAGAAAAAADVRAAASRVAHRLLAAS